MLIARYFRVKTINTLTGFKYIAEKIADVDDYLTDVVILHDGSTGQILLPLENVLRDSTEQADEALKELKFYF